MSLADELMADLEGSDEEEAEVKEEEEDMDSEDVKPSKLELEQVLEEVLQIFRDSDVSRPIRLGLKAVLWYFIVHISQFVLDELFECLFVPHQLVIGLLAWSLAH